MCEATGPPKPNRVKQQGEEGSFQDFLWPPIRATTGVL